MTIRDVIVRLLNRNAPPSDPDELVDVAVLRLAQGPMTVAGLRERGIEAHGAEYFNIVTNVASDYRILVPRRQAAEAMSVIEDLTGG